MAGPLAGIRVLDLSRLLPGPYTSLLLSDLGAEVIRVEDPRGGDYTRFMPPLAPDGTSAIFQALNRGKKSICLNLRDAEQRQAFLSLSRTADVVLESFRPGVLERMGLGVETLHAENPRLVICRISGFGQSGPDRLRAGHDLNYVARAGMLGHMASPRPLPVQVADLLGGSWPAATQICAALLGRERTGQGAVIDVSMSEGAHAALLMPLIQHALHEDNGIPLDPLNGTVPCYGVYPAADGHLAVAAIEPKFWIGFLDVIGCQDLRDAAFAWGDDGARAREAITARLRQNTVADWCQMFDARDVCVEPVLGLAAAWQHPTNRRGRLQITLAPDHHVEVPGTGLSIGTARRTPAPALGQHTDEILAGAGVSPQAPQSAHPIRAGDKP